MKKIFPFFLLISFINGAGTSLYGDVSPNISITGSSSFSVYGINQKQKQNKSRGFHTTVENAELDINVNRKSDAGHELSLMFSLNAVPALGNGPNPSVFRQVYIQFRGPAGTLQMGNVYSVTTTMTMSGGSVMCGNGAYDNSGLYGVFNASSLVLTGTDMAGDVGNATKITYLTPRFPLFSDRPVVQFGIDYTPSSQDVGDTPLVTNYSQAYWNQGGIYGSNMVSYGVNYMDSNDDWQIQGSVCGLQGVAYDGRNTAHLGNHYSDMKATRHNLKPYRAIETGVMLGYKDYQIGAGYIHNGKSAVQKQGVSIDPTNMRYEQFSQGDGGRLMNIGFTYTYGPLKASIGAQRNVQRITSSNRTTCKVVSGCVEYTIVDGLSTFLDSNFIRHKTNKAAMYLNDLEGGNDVNPVEYPNLTMPSNKGVVVGSGLKINFF